MSVKILLTTTLCLGIPLLSAATLTGGYIAGRYVTTERLQKKALAYQCGNLDRETTKFSWKLPACVIDNEKTAASVAKHLPASPPAFTKAP